IPPKSMKTLHKTTYETRIPLHSMRLLLGVVTYNYIAITIAPARPALMIGILSM
ncbi:hypothetical protein K443DRAFT_89524, partial [Laccaria amethystina LaAM-08-1]